MMFGHSNVICVTNISNLEYFMNRENNTAISGFDEIGE